MIDITTALELIHHHATPLLEAEEVSLSAALGRVLANPVVAQYDIPPFTKALMDGFAVAAPATHATPTRQSAPAPKAQQYTLTEIIAAGATPTKPLQPGEAAPIMTGAMVPEGAVRVVPIELCKVTKTHVYIPPISSAQGQGSPPTHILDRGSVLAKGSTPLTPCVIGPKEVGLLASLGYNSVQVRCNPRVHIITTGSELTAPGEALTAGKIYDSNGSQLLAGVQQLLPRANVQLHPMVQDTQKALTKAITKALETCDMLLLSGGVSMGKFDFVPEVLHKQGVTKVFHRVAIKPGKPIWFGKRLSLPPRPQNKPSKTQYVFGLPGNPLSALIGFTYMVTPLIRALQGLGSNGEIIANTVTLPLAKSLNRKEKDRGEFIPIFIQHGQVHPVKNKGSSDITVLAACDGFFFMPIGVTMIEQGALVDVRLL